jgi:hypothetical protein
MLLDQPLAGTAESQAGAVHQQLDGLTARWWSQHLQCFGSPAQRSTRSVLRSGAKLWCKWHGPIGYADVLH